MQRFLAILLIPLGSIAFTGLAIRSLGELLLHFHGTPALIIALTITFAIIGGATLLSALMGDAAPKHR